MNIFPYNEILFHNFAFWAFFIAFFTICMILLAEDFKRYIDNVEIIAQLEKLLPMWNNMTNQVMNIS